jgi:hypothetical protein
METDGKVLRDLLVKTVAHVLWDVIPYDLTVENVHINRWAFDHDIPPYAVWVALHFGFRQLPEPFFSAQLCEKMRQVLEKFGIYQHTRYTDMHWSYKGMVYRYRELKRNSEAMMRALQKEISPTDGIQTASYKYMQFMSFDKCVDPNSHMWKLVSTREQFRDSTCEEWPLSNFSWWALYPKEVELIVMAYTRPLNMRSLIDYSTGRLIEFPSTTPTAIYELALSLGMNHLPEPYATYNATYGISVDHQSALDSSIKYAHELAGWVSLNMYTRLTGNEQPHILTAYLEITAYIHDIRANVRKVRQEMEHAYGIGLPLTF